MKRSHEHISRQQALPFALVSHDHSHLRLLWGIAYACLTSCELNLCLHRCVVYSPSNAMLARPLKWLHQLQATLCVVYKAHNVYIARHQTNCRPKMLRLGDLASFSFSAYNCQERCVEQECQLLFGACQCSQPRAIRRWCDLNKIEPIPFFHPGHFAARLTSQAIKVPSLMHCYSS